LCRRVERHAYHGVLHARDYTTQQCARGNPKVYRPSLLRLPHTHIRALGVELRLGEQSYDCTRWPHLRCGLLTWTVCAGNLFLYRASITFDFKEPSSVLRHSHSLVFLWSSSLHLTQGGRREIDGDEEQAERGNVRRLVSSHPPHKDKAAVHVRGGR